MSSPIQKGYIILADLSGYTSFWRPFHYMTNMTLQKFYTLPIKPSPVKVTYEFIPLPDGRTKVSQRMRSIPRDWFTMHVIVPVMRRMLNKENDEEFGRLAKLLGKTQAEAKATLRLRSGTEAEEG